MTTQNDNNSNDTTTTSKPLNRAERRRGGKRNRDRKERRAAPMRQIMSLPVRKRVSQDKTSKFVAFVPYGEKGQTAIGYMTTTRFNPQIGVITDTTSGAMQPELYQFSVEQKSNANGIYFLLEPTPAQIAKLGPDEWLPVETWIEQRVQTLTMSMQFSIKFNREVPMTHDSNGRVVFLEQGSECPLDVPAVWLLREDGNHAYADFVQAIGASTGSGLVPRLVDKGVIDIEEVERIVVETSTPNKIEMAKDGVTEPTQHRHMRITRHYGNAHRLLCDVSDDRNRMVITGASTKAQITKAKRSKVSRLNEQAVNGFYRSQTGRDAPFAVKFQADLDQQAVLKAEKAALTILELIEQGAFVIELSEEHMQSDELTMLLADAESIDAEMLLSLNPRIQDHLRAKFAKEAARYTSGDLDAFLDLPVAEALPFYAMAKDARLAKLNGKRRRVRKSPVATETAVVEAAPVTEAVTAEEATAGNEPTVTESASEGAAQQDSAQS